MKNFTKSFLALLCLFFFCAASRAQNGNALSYNGGESDYLTLPNGIVSGVTADFTIEAWVYWKGGAEWQRVFDIGNGTSSYVYLAASSKFNGAVMFGFKIPGHVERRLEGGFLTLFTWTHVAVTVDYADPANPIGRLFVNGTQVSMDAMTDITEIPAPPTPYHLSDLGTTTENYLGRSQYAGSPYFDPYYNGGIDEFRISNTVRYTGTFTPSSSFSTDANTVALYHFDEGLGQTTVDATGNNAAGILGATIAIETIDPSWRDVTALPVFVLQFSAKKAGSAVSVKWQVYSTGDGGQYVIERSTDGVHFVTAGTIAIPYSAGNFSYEFTDRSFANGKNYYRVKIAENYSVPKYTSIALVEMNSNYAAYPAVTNSSIFVKIPEATTISIFSSNGMLVKKQNLSYSQDVDVSRLTNGAYLLVFEGTAETQRFIKF